MTSLKSSANKKAASYDLKRAFAHSLIPSLFGFLILVVCFVAGCKEFIDFMGEETIKHIPKGFNVACLTPDWGGINFICIGVGIIFALSNYYIMSRPSVNFHFSLSIKRSTLFTNRFIASTVMIALTLGAAILIDLIMNIHYFGNAAFITKMALCVYFEAFIYIMAGYTVMTIGVLSCYTVIEGLFFGSALLVLPTVAITAFDTLCSSMLNGYCRTSEFFDFVVWGDMYWGAYDKTALLLALAVANPLMLAFVPTGVSGGITDIFSLSRSDSLLYGGIYDDYTGAIDYNATFSAGNALKLPDAKYFVPLILWVGIIILLAFFARRLFINRKAERTSIHASNPIATHIYAITVALAVSFLIVFFTVEAFELGYSTPLAICIYAAAFAVTELIILSVSKRQLILKNKKEYAVPAACTIGLVILMTVLSTGGLGYSSYAPKAEDIDCAFITNGCMGDVTGSNCYDGRGGIYPMLGYNFNGLTVVKGEDVKTLLSVKDEIVKGYDNSSDAERVNIIYLTKSGRKVMRQYKVNGDTLTEATYKIMDTASYKDTVKKVITAEDLTDFQKDAEKLGFSFSDFVINPYGDGEETFNDFTRDLFENGTVNMTYFGYDTVFDIENTPGLRKALAEDLTSVSAQKLLRPDEKEICRISFSTGGEYDYGEEYYDGIESEYSDAYYEIYNTQMYIIYPFMKNTLSYLGELAVPDEKPAEIEYAYMAEFGDYCYDSYLDSSVFSAFEVSEEYFSDYYGESEEPVSAETIITDRFGCDGKITDKEELKYLAGVSNTFGKLNDDDYVIAYYVKSADGTHKIRYMCIYKDDLPK